MQQNTLSIPLAFIVLMALNLWITIGIKGFWWVKTLLIAASLTLAIFVWASLESYLGWPCRSDLPEEYQILWLSIQEPTVDKDGAVFLWARPVESEMDLVPYDLFVYKPKISEPRAFYLDYTRNLHEQSQKALESLKQGKIIIGKKADKDADGSNGSGESTEDQNANSESKGTGGETKGGDPYFFELPPTKFIEKND
jgi:hypothetical protein